MVLQQVAGQPDRRAERSSLHDLASIVMHDPAQRLGARRSDGGGTAWRPSPTNAI